MTLLNNIRNQTREIDLRLSLDCYTYFSSDFLSPFFCLPSSPTWDEEYVPLEIVVYKGAVQQECVFNPTE